MRESWQIFGELSPRTSAEGAASGDRPGLACRHPSHLPSASQPRPRCARLRMLGRYSSLSRFARIRCGVSTSA